MEVGAVRFRWSNVQRHERIPFSAVEGRTSLGISLQWLCLNKTESNKPEHNVLEHCWGSKGGYFLRHFLKLLLGGEKTCYDSEEIRKKEKEERFTYLINTIERKQEIEGNWSVYWINMINLTLISWILGLYWQSLHWIIIFKQNLSVPEEILMLDHWILFTHDTMTQL